MSISRTTFLVAVVVSSLLTASVRAEELAAQVAAKLRDSGALTGYRVNVKAKSGTVWLEGHVSDQNQLAAAVGIAETTPGVERVVIRLTIDDARPVAAAPSQFALPSSTLGMIGAPVAQERPAPQVAATPAAKAETKSAWAVVTGGLFGSSKPKDDVQLVAGTTRGRQQTGVVRAQGVPQPRGARTAMRTSAMGEPMTLPGSGGVIDGQMVPGSMRYTEGVPAPQAPVPGGQMAGGPMMGGPMPMGSAGVGMPPVPMRGEGPNMPNYAWPSYSAYPNYAALQYPTQYSPTAWPYIGPFYPYPQVPLGWRRVSLEWDDGWWWLDFDERHLHSHHH